MGWKPMLSESETRPSSLSLKVVRNWLLIFGRTLSAELCFRRVRDPAYKITSMQGKDPVGKGPIFLTGIL